MREKRTRLASSFAKFVRLALLLLCAIGSIAASQEACESPRAPSPPPPSPPPPPPPSAREQYLMLMNRALDAVIEQTSRTPQNPLIFGANLMFAHEAWVEGIPQDALEFYVDGLREAGVNRIDINMGLFPWFNADQPRGAQTIAKYDAIIQRIRNARLQLVFNPQYSTTYHRLTRFDEWVQYALMFYEQIARRYQPDIFVVVHEPTTMAGRLGVSVSPQQWADFARAATQTVQRVSPRTRCGAGGLASELDYFRAFAAVRELEVLTLDIYQLEDLPTNTQMATIARQSGKRIYIEETWRTPFVEQNSGEPLEVIASKGVGDEAFQALDGKWLRALAQYAGALGLEAVTPSWTQAFFKYVPAGGGDALDPRYTVQVIQALRNGERTETFAAFRSVISRSVPPRIETIQPNPFWPLTR